MTTHRPFVPIVLFYSFGILNYPLIHFPVQYLFLLTCGLLFLSLGFFLRENISRIFLLLSLSGLGALVVSNAQSLPADDIAKVAHYYHGALVQLKGVIVSDVNQGRFFRGHKTNFILQVESLQTPWGWKKKYY